MKGMFVGLTTLDVVYGMHGFPTEDLKHTTDMMCLSSGGSAANAAVACAGAYPDLADGDDKMAKSTETVLVTRLGTDSLSKISMDDLVVHGVDVSAVGLNGLPTVSSIVVNLDSASRTIVSKQGRYEGEQPAGDYSPCILDGVGMVLTDGYEAELAFDVLHYAKARQIPIVMDIGRYRGEESDKFFELCDIVIASEVFLDGDFDAAVEKLAGFDVKAIAMTHGSRDIEFCFAGQRGMVNVEAVKAVDTLGAGDFLHGGFVKYALVHGWDSYDKFAAALSFGSKVATKSTCFFGPRGWLNK